jgi:hypothetical protein
MREKCANKNVENVCYPLERREHYYAVSTAAVISAISKRHIHISSNKERREEGEKKRIEIIFYSRFESVSLVFNFRNSAITTHVAYVRSDQKLFSLCKLNEYC